MLALILALACGSAPTTLEGCEALRDEVARQDCRLRLLGELFAAGDERAFEEGVARLPDAVSRDLVRLRLAVGSPDRAGALCERVETEGAREKCRQVLGRPHLRAPREGEWPPPP